MKRKKQFSTELAYLVGLLILAVGTAMMTRADFGLSMVVAPAYILHLKIAEVLPVFSFGMAEYCFQALLLILTVIVMRRFKWMYLFSFGTAVLYGFMLDGSLLLIGLIPESGVAGRLAFFVFGLLLSSLGIAFLFHTYIAPEAYELIVKEIASGFDKDIYRVKTVYDVASCLFAVSLSFIFFGFGRFNGVSYGTIITTLVNGLLISRSSRILEYVFEFKDTTKLRRFFE